MRRIVVWLASTVTVLVLLFGYHTSTNEATSTQAAASSGSGTTSGSSSSGSTSSGTSGSGASGSGTSGSGTSSSGASGSGTSSSGTSGSTATATKTTKGSVVQTRWGPVQVQVTTSGHTITGVTVLQQPDGNPRDTEINDQALPILISETKAASSANIDMVSGATVTSEGYLQSLQSALDGAGF